MPTYQYVCTECQQPLEAVQSFTDAALTECPSCGGKLRKVFSAVGVVFKGSGFYRTDSRTAAKANGNGSGDTSKEPAVAAAKSDTGSTSGSSGDSGGSGGSGSSGSDTSGSSSATKSGGSSGDSSGGASNGKSGKSDTKPAPAKTGSSSTGSGSGS